jgi:hypothetical protein
LEFVFKFSSHIVWYFPFVFELDLEMPEIRVLHIERRADVFCPKKNKSVPFFGPNPHHVFLRIVFWKLIFVLQVNWEGRGFIFKRK